MKIKDILNNFKNNIKYKIKNMNTIQQLIASMCFLIVMLLVVKLFQFSTSNDNNIIDYNNIEDVPIYSIVNGLDDNMYVTIKNIADDYFLKIRESQYDENGDIITLDKIYDFIILKEYKKHISKKEFVALSQKNIQELDKISNNNLDNIPTSIIEYSEGLYLVRYEYQLEDEEIKFSVGIALDENNQQYYIWYLN